MYIGKLSSYGNLLEVKWEDALRKGAESDVDVDVLPGWGVNCKGCEGCERVRAQGVHRDIGVEGRVVGTITRMYQKASSR
jgi:hypothetical protein